jgi:hypothetical protein
MKFPSTFEFSNANSVFLENFQVPFFFDDQRELKNYYSTVNNFFVDNNFFDNSYSFILFFENFSFNFFSPDIFLVFVSLLDNFKVYSFFNSSTFLLNSSLSPFFNLNICASSTSLNFLEDYDLYIKSVVTYIDKIDEMPIFQNLENISSTYHYSVPNVKLAYPEPFIASPSFIHSDL